MGIDSSVKIMEIPMSSATTHYVLCLNGSRTVNRRMAMFFEGIQSNGLGIRVWALPRGAWVLDKSEDPTVPGRIGRTSVDIGKVAGARLSAIICFHWFVLPLAVAAGFLRRVPVLYDEHDHYEINTLEGGGARLKCFFFSLLVRSIHRVCLPWVSLVTCIHMDKQTLKRHLERWQPSVLEIHNFPASVWRESGRTQPPTGKLCFVYIGGVFTEKGVGAAAEAFQLLPNDVQENCELHVFGEGDANLIQRLRTISGITVHNGVTPAEFKNFTASHRCCGLALLASTPRYNLVGTNCTKLFEYLALGLPVIGTRVGEFPEWIEGQNVGLLIGGDLNSQQLAVQMQKLAEDTALFEEFSHNALVLMSRDEMTWEHEWSKITDTGITVRKAA
jgi:glycosyltransferase involved in cell wall biosynthesis